MSKPLTIKDLVPDDANFNTGNEFGNSLIDKSLSKFGAGRSILIDKNNRIIAGNKTIENAAANGFNDVVVVETTGEQIVAVKRTDIDLNTKKGREMALADNASAKANISWDAQALTDWDMPVAEWGVDLAEFAVEEVGEADAEPQIDKAAELNKKWKVKSGDLWQIGEHRLLCGDSTKREDVERLMGGEVSALLASDPPYNVSIDYGENVDDDKSENDYEIFSRGWFELWQEVSERQIVTPGCNNLARWCRYFDPYHIAPWTKTNSMTNGKVSRFWCWEPVMFFGTNWKRSRGNDVFDFPIGQQKEVSDHPCPKPLKMWQDLIEQYTEQGAIVTEAFSGSGTTHVASENTKRRCYGVEMEPKYCAVILERMATAFPDIEIKRIDG